MSTTDQAKHEKRQDVFERIHDATLWLGQRAAVYDRRVFDMEAARVKQLSILDARQRPELPAILDDYGQTRQVQSIDDVKQMGEALIDLLEELLVDPESYGVEIVSDLDEEYLLIPGAQLP